MQKNKTYFEQVPLDTIKQIVEEDIRRQSKFEMPVRPEAQTVEEGILLAAADYPAGGRS